MDPLSYYYQDIETFAEVHGPHIDQRYCAEALVPRSLEIAKKLFPSSEIEEARDGALLVTLDNGDLMAFICLDDIRVRAFATPIGKTYFVALSSGLVRLLFNLSLAIWRDQRFLSGIRPYARDEAYLSTDFIPSGFEELFLYDELRIPGQVGHAIFYQCFEQAVKFFWLHEIAHVFGGHLDIMVKPDQTLGIIDEFFNADELDEDELDSSIPNRIPYHAFEIQADRWALDKIFGAKNKQVTSTPANDLDLIATMIGCMLFPLTLHGYSLLREKPDSAKRHPPLWFRADDVMTAEDKAANERFSPIIQGEKDFELFRFRQKNLLHCGLASLSLLHPMFGEWLTPVSESSRQAEVQRVLDEARLLFDPWRSELSHCRRSIRIRNQNFSV